MPFLFRSVEHMRKSLDGPVGDEILKTASNMASSAWLFMTAVRAQFMPKSPLKQWLM